MKKALAGPAKRSVKKPERLAMIAAARQRLRAVLRAGERSTRIVDAKANRLLTGLANGSAKRWTRSLDAWANRILVKANPIISRQVRRARLIAARCQRWLLRRSGPLRTASMRVMRSAGRRLRPVARLLFRCFAALERALARFASLGSRASHVLTPQRAICLVIVGSAVCLAVSQFVDYHAVEIGQPGYLGLAAAAAPTVESEATGTAHAYLLVPVAALAAVLGAVA
ncbi:MAG: hypothetical protein WBM00_05760, partial [Solirubrobacterales bacterium]